LSDGHNFKHQLTISLGSREEENYTAMGVKMTFVFYNLTNFEENSESRALIDFSVLLHTIGDIAKNDPLECEIGAFVLSYCRSDIFSNIITPIEEVRLSISLIVKFKYHRSYNQPAGIVTIHSAFPNRCSRQNEMGL